MSTDDLLQFTAPVRTIHQTFLASITAHRKPMIGTWSAQSQGYSLRVNLIAPYDPVLYGWMQKFLWLRFNPQAPNEPRNVVGRPTTASWQANEQEYQVVIAPIEPVFNIACPVSIEAGLDGIHWRKVPLFNLFAPLALVPADDKLRMQFIAAQMKKMRARFFPVISPSMFSTKVSLEVETAWPYAEWMRGRVAIRLTLKNGSFVEADINASELFLIGTWKFTALFDQHIGHADIVHVDLVLPTGPITNFTHRLI